MANPLQPPQAWSEPGAPDPDLLAAVVLQTLVSHAGGDADRGQDRDSGRTLSDDDCREQYERAGGMTLAEVALACERDPANATERSEVERALEILRADELASHDGDVWRPTRAAIRAAELSF